MAVSGPIFFSAKHRSSHMHEARFACLSHQRFGAFRPNNLADIQPVTKPAYVFAQDAMHVVRKRGLLQVRDPVSKRAGAYGEFPQRGTRQEFCMSMPFFDYCCTSELLHPEPCQYVVMRLVCWSRMERRVMSFTWEGRSLSPEQVAAETQDVRNWVMFSPGRHACVFRPQSLCDAVEPPNPCKPVSKEAARVFHGPGSTVVHASCE